MECKRLPQQPTCEIYDIEQMSASMETAITIQNKVFKNGPSKI